MTLKALVEKVKSQKIGSKPVVVLPLKTWREIELRLEDLEMLNSVHLRKKIAKARAEKHLYSSAEVKRLLGK